MPDLRVVPRPEGRVEAVRCDTCGYVTQAHPTQSIDEFRAQLTAAGWLVRKVVDRVVDVCPGCRR